MWVLSLISIQFLRWKMCGKFNLKYRGLNSVFLQSWTRGKNGEWKKKPKQIEESENYHIFPFWRPGNLGTCCSLGEGFEVEVVVHAGRAVRVEKTNAASLNWGEARPWWALWRRPSIIALNTRCSATEFNLCLDPGVSCEWFVLISLGTTLFSLLCRL